MVEQTGFERPNATAEVHRYTYTPTYQLSYLLGRVLLLRLREDEKRRLGADFSLRQLPRRDARAGQPADQLPASTARVLSPSVRAMKIIPSIDLQTGRSRLVYVARRRHGRRFADRSAGEDRELFVGSGAPMLHLVDLDGAPTRRAGQHRRRRSASRAPSPCHSSSPAASTARSRSSSRSPAGATRVVVPLWAVAEDVSVLRACLRVASRLARRRSRRACRIGWRSIRGTDQPPTFRLAGRDARRLKACDGWSCRTGRRRPSDLWRMRSVALTSSSSSPAAPLTLAGSTPRAPPAPTP